MERLGWPSPNFSARCWLPVLVLLACPTLAASATDDSEDPGSLAGPAAHESISCSRCHGGEAAQYGNPAPTRCLSCHSASAAAQDLVLQAFHSPGRSCAECHSFHDTKVIRAGEARFRVTRREECAACHVPGKDLSRISDGHRAAAAVLYHTDRDDFDFDSPSAACLACHSRSGGGRPDVLQASLDFAPPRFHEEESHPYGVEVPLGPSGSVIEIRDVLDPRIRLIDGKIECLTCHDLTESAKDRLVRFESKYDLCLGCHRMGKSRSSLPSLAQNPVDP